MMLNFFNFTIEIKKKEINSEQMNNFLEYKRIEKELESIKDKFLYDLHLFQR